MGITRTELTFSTNAHLEFVVSMQKPIDAVKIGALTRVARIHEAEHTV